MASEVHRNCSPLRDVHKDETEPEPTEEANYRETMRGMRSFMNWHKIPEFETVSSHTGLLRDQFVKMPCPSRLYGMHAEKDCESSAVRTWAPEPAKLNHSFSRSNLPTAPPSLPFNQELLRHWERAAHEQTIMCNQAVGLSQCLT